jgi:hypothetical protein
MFTRHQTTEDMHLYHPYIIAAAGLLDMDTDSAGCILLLNDVFNGVDTDGMLVGEMVGLILAHQVEKYSEYMPG